MRLVGCWSKEEGRVKNEPRVFGLRTYVGDGVPLLETGNLGGEMSLWGKVARPVGILEKANLHVFSSHPNQGWCKAWTLNPLTLWKSIALHISVLPQLAGFREEMMALQILPENGSSFFFFFFPIFTTLFYLIYSFTA